MHGKGGDATDMTTQDLVVGCWLKANTREVGHRLMRRMKGVWDGTMTCDFCSHKTCGTKRYLQRGEGTGQGTGWPHAPPLLLESSSQTLELHLLLAHGRQERRGILTLLHTH